MANSVENEKNEIVNKLSKFLKLPKAQQWICCEWFYSDIDKVIFEADNDFASCIRQSFPKLKTRNLRRKQWSILRSMIGKPRRCSDAFFREERQMLDEKRGKIRLVQQRQVNDAHMHTSDFSDLPPQIPPTLSIGNRVFAHICQPEVGIFLGTIAAVDLCQHTYRVVFDRVSLGSHTVNDYETKSVLPVQTAPIRAYIQTSYRPTTTTTTTTTTSTSATTCASTSAAAFASLLSPGQLGGFPIRLLLMITRLNKILNIKKESINKLTQMNAHAQQAKANNQALSTQFQTSYAMLVLELEKLNKDLAEYLSGVQKFTEEFAPDTKAEKQSTENKGNSNVEEESRELVCKVNRLHIGSNTGQGLKSKKVLDLITQLTRLFLQLRDHVDSQHHSKLINDTIAQIKSGLTSSRMTTLFEDRVQVHVNHIQSTLSQFNELHAFKNSDNTIEKTNLSESVSSSSNNEEFEEEDNNYMDMDNSQETDNETEYSFRKFSSDSATSYQETHRDSSKNAKIQKMTTPNKLTVLG